MHIDVGAKRDRIVRAWTIIRSGFRCELCGRESLIDGRIILDSYGFPVFEEHHVTPLKKGKKGGIDSVRNSVCLCSNCHTATDFNAFVAETVEKLIYIHDTSEIKALEEHIRLEVEKINSSNVNPSDKVKAVVARSRAIMPVLANNFSSILEG